MKVILRNKKAHFNYQIEERIESGIVLVGSEIKSIRAGRININEAYAVIKHNEVFLVNCRINPYDPASLFNHNPLRQRKLLLKKREIRKLAQKVERKGYTLVPLSVYINDRNKAKIEIGLCLGKKTYDKRDAERKKQIDMEIRKAVKH